MLADDQIDRYSRQILLREIGARGQERLIASSVAIVGCGSLAHLCGLYVAGAGVGHIRLLTSDTDPDRSAAALADDLSQLNPTLRVEHQPFASLLQRNSTCDVLIATSTDLPTLTAAAVLATNECAVLAAGIRGSQGWLARHGRGACAVCIALHEGATADSADDLSSPVGVVASLLAFETLAAVLDWEDDGRASWLHYDGSAMSLSNVGFTTHPDCSACGAAS